MEGQMYQALGNKNSSGESFDFARPFGQASISETGPKME